MSISFRNHFVPFHRNLGAAVLSQRKGDEPLLYSTLIIDKQKFDPLVVIALCIEGGILKANFSLDGGIGAILMYQEECIKHFNKI